MVDETGHGRILPPRSRQVTSLFKTMNTETIAKFKARLEAQREDLKRTLEFHDESLRGVHTIADIAGPDRAAEVEELDLESRIVESEELLMSKIDHALGRIDRGTYGACESCGAEIPEARLDAKPSVSLCVNCQEAKEAAI